MLDAEDLLAIVEEVLKRLGITDNDKCILALFSAGESGAVTAIRQVRSLEKQGYVIRSVLTPQAQAMFVSGTRKFPSIPGRVPLRRDQNPMEVVEETGTIVLPTLTMNTVAKIATGISDNTVTDFVRLGLLAGKRIIAAKDACDPNLPIYRNASAAYKEMVLKHLETLRSFGIRFVDAEALADAITGVPIGTGLEKAESVPKVTTGSEIPVFSGRILDAGVLRSFKGSFLWLDRGTLVTPLAKDIARERGIHLQYR